MNKMKLMVISYAFFKYRHVKNITIDCSISSSFSFLFSYLSLFGKYNFIIFFSFQPNFKATAIIFFGGTKNYLLYFLGLVYSLHKTDLKYFTP
jgi:hypothetical protein